MKFEFDTTTDGAKEAAALVSAVAILFGPSVLQAIDASSDRLDERAPDGHPDKTAFFENRAADMERRMSQDTSAADAFGEGTAETILAQGNIAPVSTVTLDTAGIPWDERIHSSTKGTNKDGTWSRRRNTPDATFDAVMAELKGGAAPNPPAPPAPHAPADEPAIVVPQPPATTTQTPASGPITFPQLMVKITKAQTAGTIDKATVDGFLASFGLDKIAGLASAGPDTIAAVNAMVDDHVAG